MWTNVENMFFNKNPILNFSRLFFFSQIDEKNIMLSKIYEKTMIV